MTGRQMPPRMGSGMVDSAAPSFPMVPNRTMNSPMVIQVIRLPICGWREQVSVGEGRRLGERERVGEMGAEITGEVRGRRRCERDRGEQRRFKGLARAGVMMRGI